MILFLLLVLCFVVIWLATSIEIWVMRWWRQCYGTPPPPPAVVTVEAVSNSAAAEKIDLDSIQVWTGKIVHDQERQVLQVEFQQENGDESHDGSMACAICLLEYEVSETVQRNPYCSHVFHQQCLQKWLLHGKLECPCCRTAFLQRTVAQVKERFQSRRQRRDDLSVSSHA